MKKIKILGPLLLFCITAMAQLPVGRDTITVLEGGKVLKNAWAGGLNSSMFSQMDIDMDLKQDLVVFDKVDNFGYGILRCFINKGGVGQTKYVYDALYTSKFPRVEQWVYLFDYNKDGKADIFTHTVGGIKVFRNASTLGNISFQLAKPVLYSNYTPTATAATMVNIFASQVVTPAIADQDNDGDLDILAFSSGGNQIEYHKNMSVEKLYGTDSLIFNMVDFTWGDITENFCSVIMNQYIVKEGDGNQTNPNKIEGHSGSSLMCFDRDGDGDQDLLLSDISCNVTNYCENGGTVANAHITDTTRLYPNYPAKASTQVIRIIGFPSAYNIDVDNDGKKDLIACPGAINSENYASVWMYKNVSATSTYSFQFVKNNFLQEDMIEVGEGATPILFDVDNDGLLDMIVGNYGYFTVNTAKTQLTYYRNVGTLTQPSYSLITRDYGNMGNSFASDTLYGLTPTVGDIDGDGDLDMILADLYGKINWWENTAGAGNPCNFSIFKKKYFNLGSIAKPRPQLIDVNRDGLLDLLVGTLKGQISYFKNKGTATSPSFTLMTSNFGGVNVKNIYGLYGSDGSCAPFMYDVAGSYKLLCGSISGAIFYYDNIDGNLTGTFNRIDTIVNLINDGPASTLQYVDINGDSKRDLIVGNYAGGLSFFSSKNYFIGINELENNVDEQLIVFPNPATNYLEVKCSNTLVNKTEIVLSDMLGKTVLTQSATGSGLTLQTENLSRGVYLLRVNISVNKQQQTIYKKIVLQ